jgi:hypothetical protein
MAKSVKFDLQTAKKYVFWACVPVGLIIAIVSFYLSVTTVASDIDSRKRALDGIRSSVKSVQNATPHPNQETIDEIKRETGTLNARVFSAWEILEKDQKERNDWTKLGLNDRALKEITQQKFLDPLEPSTLNNYRLVVKNKITKELPALIKPCEPLQPLLAKQATGRDARTPVRGQSRVRRGNDDRRAGGGMGIAGGEDEYASVISKDGIVAWYPPELVYTIVDWDAKLARGEEWKVWLTQEEVWVYDALLNIIKQSNDKVKAGSPRNAAVKGIGSILIGQEASYKLADYSLARMLGASTVPAYRGSGDDDDDKDSAREESPRGMMPSRSSEDTGEDDEKGMGRSSSGRQVDQSGQPLQTRTGALKSRYVDSTGKPAKYDASAPYRRMPIFLSLVVSQAKIPEILAECANCAMPIDVLWVRVNPIGDQQSFVFDPLKHGLSSGGSSAASAGLRSSRAPRREDSGASTLLALGNLSGNVDINQFGADAVPVEIYGCINIFSSPDKNKVQQAAADSGASNEQ